VDNGLTQEDRAYIPSYLAGIAPLPNRASYEDEIHFIVAVQNAVLTVAPLDKGLPFDQQREPKALYLAQQRLCFDRGRVNEKILRYAGFETRHIALYSTKETHSGLRSLITPGIDSHAVTEVLTQKGWLVVDSNHRWVSLDSNSRPLSMAMIQLAQQQGTTLEWRTAVPSTLYVQPFIFIYGLYSRHCRFYPPYNAIPDVHYGELIDNLF